jgi:hypothetical protein
MVIASFAYRELAPDDRARIVKVLRKHPAYSRGKKAFGSNPSSIDEGEFIVMQAAKWSDDIREDSDPNHDESRIHQPLHCATLISPELPDSAAETTSGSARKRPSWSSTASGMGWSARRPR